jgi:hypothetical protein
MNITLTPYPVAKAPKNKWFLEVKFMSGDADAYETEKWQFDTQEEFEKVHALVSKWLNKHYIDPTDKQYRKDFESAGLDLPGDVTADHQWPASVDSIEDMYYYDQDGVKFKITING